MINLKGEAMSRKEPIPLPNGVVKPSPPPPPPKKCAIFELEDETFFVGMENVSDSCEEIMSSRRSTVEAKTAALDLQLAALRMKMLIRSERFWK